MIVTVEPASTLRTRTRIVFSWPARTRSPLGVDSVHGGCTTAAGLTATAGTTGGAATGGLVNCDGLDVLVTDLLRAGRRRG